MSEAPITERRHAADAADITYFQTKDFARSLQRALATGGQNRKKHDKVRVVLGSLDQPNPFLTLTVTNNGEKRIKNCVKYDLGDGWRLVTQQTANQCVFHFVGSHDETDKWLDGHKGDRIAVDRGVLRIISGGNDTLARDERYRPTLDTKPFIDHFDDDVADFLIEDVGPRSLRKSLEVLDPGTTWGELQALVSKIDNPVKADLILSVFTSMINGDVEGARVRIDLERGIATNIEDFNPDAFINVGDGDDVRRIKVGSTEYEDWLKAFEKRSEWHDWFLFLHPKQEKVVLADYPGPAQLSGVSGSGKTCVVVQRALRLAKKPAAKILLLTLNRSLAGLLQHLVNSVCIDDDQRSRIRVTSFFELAQELLLEFEPENALLYKDITWKLEEHVDEIFREYYRCWANNDDCSIIFPIHRSLNGQGVSAETYLRDEFDWIRSAFFKSDREAYLDAERSRRRFPITRERRSLVLKALEGWERKMSAIGVIDYIGLTSALTLHLDKLHPAYTNILVDEAQDFGTTELNVVRRLVKPASNDIFLCGDIAQTILPKHQSAATAGITEMTRVRIRQNYRNSREILTAAHALLNQNLHDEMFDSSGLEILDPKLANFSGSAPLALAADTLEDEIMYARAFAEARLSAGVRNICIAFAGHSTRSVKLFSDRCGVTALDGNYDPKTDRLVFSDLEQTKGYEFDCVVIVNCSEGVIPARDALPEEAFRDACKLYVAMTRAKRELVLSFNRKASHWILAVGDAILIDLWSEFEIADERFRTSEPDVLPEVEIINGSEDEFALSGRQFLYTHLALDLSPDTQDKLVEIVDGKGRLTAGATKRRLRWRNGLDPTVVSPAAIWQEYPRSAVFDGCTRRIVATHLTFRPLNRASIR